MQQIIKLFEKELVEIFRFQQRTADLYSKIAGNFLKYAEYNLKIKPYDVETTQLEKWFVFLKQKHKSKHHLKTCKAALSRFFELLIKAGRRTDNPVSAMAPIRLLKHRSNHPVTTGTAVKLLNMFDRKSWTGKRNFIIVSMLWALGLRVSELVSLKLKDYIQDFNPDKQIGLLCVHGKGLKERKLFVVDLLYCNIKNYLQHPKSPRNKNNLFLPQVNGKKMATHRVRQIIKETALKAGITERLTPHVLRHTFATQMYQKGIPLNAIKELMGHESSKETSMYIHISQAMQAETLEQISVKEE